MSRTVLRSPAGIAVVVIMWAAGAVTVASFLLSGARAEFAAYPVGVVAAGWLSWLLLWWPRVVIDQAGVEVRGPVRTVWLPYGTILAVDARGTLRFETERGAVHAWAVPTAGRRALARGDAGSAGTAIEAVRARVETALPSPAAPLRRTNWWALAVTAALVVATALAAVLG